MTFKKNNHSFYLSLFIGFQGHRTLQHSLWCKETSGAGPDWRRLWLLPNKLPDVTKWVQGSSVPLTPPQNLRNRPERGGQITN